MDLDELFEAGLRYLLNGFDRADRQTRVTGEVARGCDSPACMQ